MGCEVGQGFLFGPARPPRPTAPTRAARSNDRVVGPAANVPTSTPEGRRFRGHRYRQPMAVHWDPFDTEMNAHPYGLFRRMRDAAPLYFSEQYGFYAVTRADDVEQSFTDPKRLINGRGAVVDFVIIPDIDVPTRASSSSRTHRSTRSTADSSRACSRRDACSSSSRRCVNSAPSSLDPFVGSDGFDFVKDYAEIVSSRSIGLLLGIPESDQMAVRQARRAAHAA